jgi:serine protease inhibitor
MRKRTVPAIMPRVESLGSNPPRLIPAATVLRVLLLLPACFCQGHAQEVLQAQPATFLRANDSFGFGLLRSTHGEFQNRNVVVSPLPISLAFAALWDGGADIDSAKEIYAAFHWAHAPTVPAAAKMVLTRFQKPQPHPRSHRALPLGMSRARRLLLSGDLEEVWLSAAFLYRAAGSLSPDFIDRVTYDIGLPFRNVGKQTPQSAALATAWDPTAPMPDITGERDFWITSSTHLRTSWAGNTFAESQRKKENFHLSPGEETSVDFLTSELEVYLYARTDEFEAVELPGKEATILLVLPPATSSIEQLEAAIATKPDMVEPLLTRSVGAVTLPPFHFAFEADLRSSIERLGVHRVFADLKSLLPMAPELGGILRGIAQKTEITVDENGIRADSGTIGSGILGGMMASRTEPFHMILDRPFLFFVRDNLTKGLIFEGAVMNPALR